MHDINKEIRRRQEYLKTVIEQKEKELKKFPTGYVKAVKHGKGYQYYFRENHEDRDGTYIKKKDIKRAIRIAQREYDEKVLRKAKEELNWLFKIQGFYEKGIIEQEYDKLPVGKKLITEPIKETAEQFKDRLFKVEFKKLPFAPNAPEYYSNKNEKMRSKSEILIANLFTQYGISYIYEMPFRLKSGKIVYPDFTILDFVRHRLVFWEHLGMLDDEDYLNDNILKMREYEKNGYHLGDNLFISVESSSCQIDIKLIEEKVSWLREYVMGDIE